MWYQEPIRPLDPVIEDDPDSRAIRYYRANFTGSGQDSFTSPPAQNQGMWQKLQNLMPITRGVLTQRRGYSNLFTIPDTNVGHLYEYQNEILGSRALVHTSTTALGYFTDDTRRAQTSFYTPTSTGEPARMIDCRNYAYFYNGSVADRQKWTDTGASSGQATTNWGIDINSAASAVGPNAPGTVANTGSGDTTWSNPNNVKVEDGNVADSGSLTPGQNTNFLTCTNFGLSVSGRVVGIKVEIKLKVTTALSAYVQLVKNSTQYGELKTLSVTNNTLAFSSFGGTSDLWSGSWMGSDFNSNFGVAIRAHNDSTSPSDSMQIDFVRITVYTLNVAMGMTPNAGAGSINLTIGRVYFYVFKNSTTGHISDLSVPTASTGPLINGTVSLSSIPVSTDPQVDTKDILATADGGDETTLYFVAELPNATTTYTDTTTEPNLLENQQYLFTDDFGNELGVSGNDPPPNGNFGCKHNGRLYLAKFGTIYFSKNLAELTLPNGFIAGKYEESWPGDNSIDIGQGAETVKGLLSDGTRLFIGTERHIHVLYGDSPDNFQSPQIALQEVGLLGQDTWQLVYAEGQPYGAIWLTPDLRIIGSDFNTYADIGHPIQDVLNAINVAEAGLSHAMFVSDNTYDLYILAIPTGTNTTCDTHCVYDMRHRTWFIWQPKDFSTAMCFHVPANGIPQWLFISPVGGSSDTFKYDASTSDDQGNANATFQCIARTSWLHLGSPTTRKILNEIEVIGDTGLLVTIEGANTHAEFLNPATVIANAPLKLSPFGTWKVFLAGRVAKHRYYRITFTETSHG